MPKHPYEQFFTQCTLGSGLSTGDQKELLSFFDSLEVPHAEFFYVLLSEEPNWLPKILANYRAKCEAFRTRDDALWQQILKTEIADIEAAN